MTLATEWKDARAEGVKFEEFASQKGLTVKALRNRLYRGRQSNKENGQAQDYHGEEIKILKEGAGIDVSSTSERIRTLEDQIRICKIDTDKLQSPYHTVNSWETALKFNDPDRIVFTPVFQVKSRWEPKHPEAITPVVHPVTSSVPMLKKAKTKLARGRILVLPDPQIGFRKDHNTNRLTPFHDRGAMDIALQVAQQDETITDVIWLGDVIDFSEWSDKFLKEPSFYFTTQPAIYEAHWWLSQFRQARPKAAHKKLEGNHEFRLPKQIITHLTAAYGLQSAVSEIKYPVLSVETLLGLESLGVEYVSGYPNNETYVGPVRFLHGDIARNGAGDTVKKVVQETLETAVQGHIHKIEMAGRTVRERGKPKPVLAYSPGCLCRIDYVVPGHTKNQHWQQGFALIDYDGDDYGINQVVINDGRAIYNGQRFQARSVVDQLGKDMKMHEGNWVL